MYDLTPLGQMLNVVHLNARHYQDAYVHLQTMFGSTAILPPRTKRWAEAKVLADCISVKICKLYLYNSEHSLALAHHTAHMRKFADFSRGWGIGEETFEFWSWLARQHRIFAELLEQGTRSTPGLTIPTHLPTTRATPAGTPTPEQATGVELDSMRVLGLNPTQALQHPGFYYYTAAKCTENRRARFLTASETQVSVDNLVLVINLSAQRDLFCYSPALRKPLQASRTKAKSTI